MCQQSADMHVQATQIGNAGASGRNFASDIAELLLIAGVKGLVSGHIRVFTLHLQLLLMGEVFVYIVHEELHSGLHGGSTLALATGIQQRIHSTEQLTVLPIDDSISGFQVFR